MLNAQNEKKLKSLQELRSSLLNLALQVTSLPEGKVCLMALAREGKTRLGIEEIGRLSNMTLAEVAAGAQSLRTARVNISHDHDHVEVAL